MCSPLRRVAELLRNLTEEPLFLAIGKFSSHSFARSSDAFDLVGISCGESLRGTFIRVGITASVRLWAPVDGPALLPQRRRVRRGGAESCRKVSGLDE